jgi:Icc-related predicted phosphoesterase
VARKVKKIMIIDCIADLHGHYPKLEGGDLLIVAGDLTARDTIYEHADFLGWLNIQKYKKKIFIAGNHDNNVDKKFDWDETLDYLCDSGAEFEGLKIWGSPWTPLFEGINPACKAFMLSEGKLEAKFAKIPDDTDILVTHGPPLGVFDGIVNNIPMKNGMMKKIVKYAGSRSLDDRVSDIKPRLHVFGHIHEGYGQDLIGDVEFVNCSHVNERYEPVNKPIRVIL